MRSVELTYRSLETAENSRFSSIELENIAPKGYDSHISGKTSATIKPVRIQLRRTKGWRMPENTVKVDRTTKWGNPFKVGETYPIHEGYVGGAYLGESAIKTAACSVAAFRSWAMDEMEPLGDLSPLRGKNLACWCHLDAPCHADVLLELANAPVRKEVV